MPEQLIQWAPAASPISVEYPLGLMSKIRDHVIVGFHRLAKRGIECGGILFGTREGRRVVLHEIREIRCEYKTGPSFVLSDADRDLLAKQLGPVRDPELAGLIPVGLYISHTKDDITATERDLAVFNEFFPDPWQVLLILRPARQGAVRAGFFVRESLGALQAERSYEEFQLDPPSDPVEAAALLAAARAQAESPVSQPQGRTRQAPAPAAPEPAVAAAFNEPLPEFLPRGRSSAASPQTALAPPPWQGGLPDFPSRRPMGTVPRAPAEQPVRERHWGWLLAWFGAVLLAGFCGYWVWTIRTPDPILLRVAELNGDLRIEWDRASATVLGASEGMLQIRDGERTRDIKLSAEQLASGFYLFPAGTSDVTVKLAVSGLLRPTVEEAANFVAEAQPGSGPRGGAEVREHRDRLLVENRRLKAEVQRLEDRIKQMESQSAGSAESRRTRRK